jgi:hypothetical protein
LQGDFIVIDRSLRLGVPQHVKFAGYLRLQLGFDDGDSSTGHHH